MRDNDLFVTCRPRSSFLVFALMAFLIATCLSKRGFSQFEAIPADTSLGHHKVSSLVVVPEDFQQLKLAPGFLVSMDVYDAPELAGDLRIDANGDVMVSTIGRVHIGGETLPEAAAEIEARLRDGKILNKPQVNLNVSQYASHNITVLGEVHDPGRIELLAPHTLGDILALAGGETQYAGNTVEIRRGMGPSSERFLVHYSRNRADQPVLDTLILPGDSITVPREGIVYVLGGVNRPGGYLMQQDGELDVTQALSLANGTQLQAAVGSMRLIRKLPDGKVEEFPIPFRDIVRGKKSSPRLQAEDVIYVPISKVKVVLGAGILQTAATAAVYAR